jgi:hypothetical protein
MANKNKNNSEKKEKDSKFQENPPVNIEDIGKFLEDIRRRAIETSDWAMMKEWMKLYKDYVQLAITVRKVKEGKEEKAQEKEQQLKDKQKPKKLI